MRTRTIGTLALGLICSGSAAWVAACSGDDNIEAPGPDSGLPDSTVSPDAGPNGTLLPTGQRITPTAAPGSTFQPLNPDLPDFPAFTASQALSEALSPDHKTLLILTSGYHLNGVLGDAGVVGVADASQEYVFVYDVSTATPVKRQVIKVPNTYTGIAFAPDGSKFYVAGGADDNVHTFVSGASGYTETGDGAVPEPIALGHLVVSDAGKKIGGGVGLLQLPVASGLAVTADGKRLVVANHYNDSVTVVDLTTGAIAQELDLRPGKSGGTSGTAGGENPFGVAIVGSNTAYVSAERDREIVVIDLSGPKASIVKRIPVEGTPNKILLNKDQTKLYVAADNSDDVNVIDTQTNTVTRKLVTMTLAGSTSTRRYRGAAPNSIALSPDEATLYVTNGGANAVSIIDLASGNVTGTIPTGWYPHAVVVSGDGNTLYVVNGKSLAGPNTDNCKTIGGRCIPDSGTPYVTGEYVLQLEKAGFSTIPVPSASALSSLSNQVAVNNGYGAQASAYDAAVMATLRQKIKHVIYIVKENRTYDQVLGDLGQGNGDPKLVQFGEATTPNLHMIAKQFVDLDNFYDPGEVSGNGWAWSTSARETDYGVKTIPLNYSGRSAPYDTEGTNRNINVGVWPQANRSMANPVTPNDQDLLPGTNNVAAPDGPEGEAQQGYLWNSALRAGLTVRNYGFFCDLVRYNASAGPAYIPLTPTDPGTTNPPTVVAYAANPELVPLTDQSFRGFDDAYPDFYREREWEREFNGFVQNGNLPALSLVRFMNDHTGSYSTALNKVDTPEKDVADNDYAVGKLLEALSKSVYAKDTLVFVVEDDAQDGADHVDAHRSIGFVAGPYVKHGATVSTHYSTINMLRTIEDVLGIDHLSVYDAYQGPMADVFDLNQSDWTFTAKASTLLTGFTTLPIPKDAAYPLQAKPTHDMAYWAAKTKGMDFTAEDRIDSNAYNRILWQGLKGQTPYPAQRSGETLGSAKARRDDDD